MWATARMYFRICSKWSKQASQNPSNFATAKIGITGYTIFLLIVKNEFTDKEKKIWVFAKT